MSLLGKRLIAAREARGVTPLQVEIDTRIRASVIQALEEGNYENLPPEPFLRGLIRSYANYLRIDAQEMLDLYTADLTPAPPAPPPATTRRSRLAPKPTPQPPAERPHGIEKLAALPSSEPPPPSEVEFPEIPVAPPSTRPEPMPPTRRRISPVTLPTPEPPTVRGMPLPATAPERLPPPEKIPVAAPMSAPQSSRLEPRTGESHAADQKDSQAPPEQLVSLITARLAFLQAKLGGLRSLPARVWIIVAIAVALVVVVGSLVVFSRFAPSGVFLAARTMTATRAPATVTPTTVPGATPTSIPTLAATAPPFTPAAIIASPTARATPKPGTTGLILEIAANETVKVRVGLDGALAFNETMPAGAKGTWSARETLYLQMENFKGATVLINGNPVGALNFGERTLLERQWVLNSAGKAITTNLATPRPITPPINVSSVPPAATPSSTPSITHTATPTGPTRTLTPFF